MSNLHTFHSVVVALLNAEGRYTFAFVGAEQLKR